MRVVAGALRGLRLESIVKEDIRPTTDKVKESVFNILQFEIRGKIFLDLFGGSGQMGIEAASRGASEVIIVEKNFEALDIIEKNLKKIQNKFNISVINSYASDFLVKMKNDFENEQINKNKVKDKIKNTRKNKIDIAFLDPPYKSRFLDESSQEIDAVMDEKGIIITETASNQMCQTNIGRFKNTKSYKYGNVMVSFYKI